MLHSLSLHLLKNAVFDMQMRFCFSVRRLRPHHRDPVDRWQLSMEVRDLCNALWKQVNSAPPDQMASDAVLDTLVELMVLPEVRSNFSPAPDLHRFLCNPDQHELKVGGDGLDGSAAAALPES